MHSICAVACSVVAAPLSQGIEPRHTSDGEKERPDAPWRGKSKGLCPPEQAVFPCGASSFPCNAYSSTYMPRHPASAPLAHRAAACVCSPSFGLVYYSNGYARKKEGWGGVGISVPSRALTSPALSLPGGRSRQGPWPPSEAAERGIWGCWAPDVFALSRSSRHHIASNWMRGIRSTAEFRRGAAELL